MKAAASLDACRRLRWSMRWIIARLLGSVAKRATALALAAFKRNTEVEKMEQKTEMDNAVSEQQRRYIYFLARNVGLKVDVSKIGTREQASACIDRLKQMNANNGNKTPVDWELKDRKTAFGLATKLVFSLYVDRGRNPATTEGFWKDVYKFYQQHQEKQELVFRENVNGDLSPRS